MPGSLTYSSPSTVMPYSLCSAFAEDRIWACLMSEPYADGRTQASVLVAQPRRSWTLTKTLTYTEWIAFKAFYEARRCVDAFYWYPIKTQYDASGVSTTGRYTVRFHGALQQTTGIARFVVSIQLIEIV